MKYTSFIHTTVLAAAMIFATGAASVSAQTFDFYVATNGSDANQGTQDAPFLTIANAIARADIALAGPSGSAIIHVAAGTYNESGLVLTNRISIVGFGSATNPANSVIVQPAKLAGNDIRAFHVDHPDAILQNVKVKVGVKTSNNNGVNLYLADGTVRGCWVAGNGESRDNLYMTGGVVEDTLISDGNHYNWWTPGDGINVYATGGRIRRCAVTGGTGGVSVSLSGTAVMENSLVAKTTNYRTAANQNANAWAVTVDGSAKLVNCTLVDNICFVQTSDGGLKTPAGGAVKAASTAQIVNCVIYGNDCDKSSLEWGDQNAARFLGCAVPETAAGLTNQAANGNIVVDDHDFDGFAAGRYWPVHGSRLIDAGADLSAIGEFSATDLLGDIRQSPASSPVDIGCYEVDQDSLSCGFTVSAWAAFCGEDVVFTPTVYGAGSATVICRWDFDDGGSAIDAGLAPYAHAFVTARRHVVTLSVSTDGGSTWAASYTAPIPVLTAPQELWVDIGNAYGAAYPYGSEATAASDLFTVLEMLTNTVSAGATALDGVTVKVKPGTYPGFGYPKLASAVTVVGVGGRGNVIFDAGRAGLAFHLAHEGATLSGITIKNGKGVKTTPYGGNVSIDNGVVTNCVVADGRTSDNAYAYGLNIYMKNGLVVDSEISGGTWDGAWHHGRGLNMYMSGGRVVRCVVRGARGTTTTEQSAAVWMTGGTLENCLVTDNSTTYGAIFLDGASAKALNCTVVANTSSYSSGVQNGVGVVCNNASARVVNCAIFGNGATAKAEWGNKNAACFYSCAFAAEASFTGSNSTATSLVLESFSDYVGGDYTPASGGVLDDAGEDLSSSVWSVLDLVGLARPSGAAWDIGCYELDKNQLTAGFTASTAVTLNGVGVVFTPVITGASGSLACKWDFDDGGNPEVVQGDGSVIHAFSMAKLHDVTLSVSTDGGSTWVASYTTPNPILTAPPVMWVDAANANPAHPYATEATAATNIAEVLNVLTNKASAGATALDGVTIKVKTGTYPGFGYPKLASAVTIVGVGGRGNVIFDAEQAGLAFHLAHEGATLSGITIKNGKGVKTTPYGGNVSIDNGVVTNCVVADGRTSDTPYAYGLNIYMKGGLVIDSEISGGIWDGPWHHGRGLNIYMSGGRVVRCVVRGARGTTTTEQSAAVWMTGGAFENCLVTANSTTYGAIYLEGASAVAVNCSVVANTSSYSSGVNNGVGVVCNNASARVVNCAIFGNGATAKAEWGNKNAACFYSCAFAPEAAFTGNNSTATSLTDAAFRRYALGDYRPKSGGVLYNGGDGELYATYAVSETDLSGQPRLQNKVIDIGCHEILFSAGTKVLVR